MSPTTERLGQKKSPPERKPICVLIHSAGLDMSKQPAFTAVATLFTSNCQAVGISTHSLNQGVCGANSKQNTLTHELKGINILAETRRTRLPGSLRHLDSGEKTK